ncbi:hypothetical protein SAMN05660368_00983 [Marvinbryantia formatexigens]|nr:hypothetical protein SAMN05660368_00983 [Marvinbryantia formatexigens]
MTCDKKTSREREAGGGSGEPGLVDDVGFQGSQNGVDVVFCMDV